MRARSPFRESVWASSSWIWTTRLAFRALRHDSVICAHRMDCQAAFPDRFRHELAEVPRGQKAKLRFGLYVVSELQQMATEIVALRLQVGGRFRQIDLTLRLGRSPHGLERGQQTGDFLSHVVHPGLVAIANRRIVREMEFLAQSGIRVLDEELVFQQLAQIGRVPVEIHPELGDFHDTRFRPNQFFVILAYLVVELLALFPAIVGIEVARREDHEHHRGSPNGVGDGVVEPVARLQLFFIPPDFDGAPGDDFQACLKIGHELSYPPSARIRLIVGMGIAQENVMRVTVSEARGGHDQIPC